MRITFENRYKEESTIAHVKTQKDALDFIKNFLEEAGFTSYYMRISYIEERKRYWIDVGSHSEFFYVYEED